MRHLVTRGSAAALAPDAGMRIIGLAMPMQARTIDEYMSSLSREQRAALEGLRRTIRKILPNAEECIRYAIPAFRVDGRVIAGFAATGRGLSYYPFSGSTLRRLARELEGYDQTKSALHFAADKPLPVALVRKLLRARLAEGKD